MSFTRRMALLLALSSAVPFALADAAETITVTDALNRTITLPKAPERVIVNFNFEEFTAIAGQEGWTKVVGISRAPWESWRPANFTRYKAVIPNLADMPDIGNSDDNNFFVEKLIGLKPDVVLMAEWTFKSLKDGKTQIDAAGIPIVVIDYNAQMLERHLLSTRAIGKVMGAEARADAIARFYEGKYNDIMQRIAGAKTAGSAAKKVYVELGRDGKDKIGNSYNDTMWGKVVTLLGAQNIAAGKLPGPWGPLNAEAVIAENPDLIVITGSSWAGKANAVFLGYDSTAEKARQTLAPYATRAGWDSLKAVQGNGLVTVEHGLSRALFDYVGMQFLAKQLYPEAFKDIDPAAEFADYHRRFLPIAYSGTWMATAKP